MKKNCRFLIAFALLVFLLLPFALVSRAENKNASFDALWEKRCAEDALEMLYPQNDFDEGVFLPAFRGNDMRVLLFTRIGKDLTVVRSLYDTHGAETPKNEKDWEFFGKTPCVKTQSGDNRNVYAISYIPEFLPAIQRCWTGKNVADDVSNAQIRPYLRELIKEFNITKEELKEACRLSRTNPDMVKPYFSAFSDEEFSEMKNAGEFSCTLDQTFLLDALYVEDDRDCAALCCTPFAAVAGNTLIRQYDLMHDVISPEKLLSMTETEGQKKNVIQFLRHARNYALTVVDGEYGSFDRLNKMFGKFDETFKLAGKETYEQFAERELPLQRDGLDLTLLLVRSEGLPSYLNGQMTAEELSAAHPIIARVVDIDGQKVQIDDSPMRYLPLRAEYETPELLLGLLKDYYVEPDDRLTALFLNAEYGSLKEYEGKLYLCVGTEESVPSAVESVWFGHVDDRTVRINCNRKLSGMSDERPAIAVFSASKTKDGYKFVSLCIGTYVNEDRDNVWTPAAGDSTPPKTGARTGVYFAAAGLSALTLAAGALLLRRKKRRLDG